MIKEYRFEISKGTMLNDCTYQFTDEQAQAIRKVIQQLMFCEAHKKESEQSEYTFNFV